MKGERYTKDVDDRRGESERGYEPKHARGRNRSLGHKINKFFGRGEKPVKDFGATMLGESDVSRESKKPCEDELFADQKKGIFAVFDGMGGDFGGGEASKTAAQAIGKILEYVNPKTSEELGQVITRVAHRIERNPKAGATTGVAGRIITTKNSKKKLIYANVGDSRIYLVREGEASRVTCDEGLGHNIWNALGLEIFKMKQVGEVKLEERDRLVFCTDGVTGDTEDDFMSDEELATIVSEAKNCSQAAKELTEKARKKDDRTAIVVEV
jgi:protein phosphatase